MRVIESARGLLLHLSDRVLLMQMAGQHIGHKTIVVRTKRL